MERRLYFMYRGLLERKADRWNSQENRERRPMTHNLTCTVEAKSSSHRPGISVRTMSLILTTSATACRCRSLELVSLGLWFGLATRFHMPSKEANLVAVRHFRQNTNSTNILALGLKIPRQKRVLSMRSVSTEHRRQNMGLESLLSGLRKTPSPQHPSTALFKYCGVPALYTKQTFLTVHCLCFLNITYSC
ncbi:hypothetical protein NEOLEDRAFT_104430 [Neolentinus lepideus HHB14362 ss-1]|uniref:Uncharacterized protein n=1 Tax=Neolentinus lepideus HHB14362 ss-1 TaxID=1314782 RepID=A0A165U452_9AGAM|nr:hypothetical protein NEOLEDRAFT_104430 [Neolentinus lepideus HHB14362 ss-1]